MNNNPLVSIIIPNYNHARFLDERMQSILNQTFSDFEIIFLDDCSTDNSLQVIEKYRTDKRFKEVIVNEKNSGSPFKQWEKGIALAKGELIWIAESDDSCDKSMLETLVKEFKANSNLSFAFACSKVINEKGKTTEEKFQYYFTDDIHTSGKNFIKKYLIWGNAIVNGSSVLFCKKNALDIDSSFTEMRSAGDWLFWTEMAERGDVAVKAGSLNHYRMYGSNTTSTMRMSGTQEDENFLIYTWQKEHNHINWINDIRIKKKNVWSIKYANEYESEEIRKEKLKLWKPTPLTLLLAFASKVKLHLASH